MKPLPLLKQLSGLILVFMLAACQVASPLPGATRSPSLAPTRTRIPTASPTQTVAPLSATPTATLAPTPTATLPPPPPVMDGLVRTGEIGRGELIGAAWSPDGSWLAVASSVSVEIYDARSFSLVHRLDTGPIYSSVQFSPDSRHLLVPISWDEIQVWDVGQGEMEYQAELESFPAEKFIFANDHEIAVIESPCLGAYGVFECISRIKIYAMPEQTERLVLHPSSHGLRSVPSDETYSEAQLLLDMAASQDGKHLAAAGYDHQIHVWDLETGEERLTLAGHTAEPLALAISPDGTTLVSGGADATLRWWSLRDGRLLRTLRDFPASICEVDFSGDGSELFIRLSGSGDIQVRSTSAGALRAIFSIQNSTVLAASPDGNRYLSTNWADLSVHSRRTGRVEVNFPGYRIGSLGIALSQDGNYLALAGAHKVGNLSGSSGFQVWDVIARQPITTTWLTPGGGRAYSSGVDFHPHNHTLALADPNQGVFLWNWQVSAPQLILPPDPEQDKYSRSDEVVFSPSGDELAIFGSHNLHMWDVTAKRLLFGLEVGSDWVREVIFSPDGGEIALKLDRAVQIRDTTTGEILSQLEQPEDEDWLAISFPAAGRLFIANHIETESGDSYLMDAWDYSRGERTKLILAVNGQPKTFWFSPDGKLLVASSEAELTFLSTASGQRLGSMPVENNISPGGITFGGDQRTLVFTQKSTRFLAPLERLEAWDASELFAAAAVVQPAAGEAHPYPPVFEPLPGLQVQSVPSPVARSIQPSTLRQLSETLRIGKGAANQAAWSADSKILGVASATGIFLYDAQTLVERNAFLTPVPALSLAFSPDGRWLAAGLQGGLVQVWDLSSGQVGHTFQSRSRVLHIAFSPNSRQLAFAGSPAVIAIFDLEAGIQVQTLAGYDTEKALAFSPDGKTIYAQGPYDSLRGWNIDTGRITLALSLDFSEGRGIWAFALDPAGRLLFDGRQDGRFHVWDVRSGERVLSQKLAGEEDTVYYDRGVSALAYDARHNLIAAAGYDMRVGLYNANTGELQRQLEGHYQRLVQLAFRPDGGRLLSLDKHSNLKIWNPATGELVSTLSAHLGRLHSLNFAADGSLQAASGDTGRVFTSAGALRLETGGLGGELLALSPDSRLAAVYHSREIWDEHMQVWELQTRQMVYEFNESPTGGPSGARGYFDRATFSRDGDRLLGTGYTAGWPWDLETGETLAYPEIRNATHACTPRLSLCAFQEYGGDVSVWDFHTMVDSLGSFEWGFDPQPMAFHPDGVQLATSDLNRIRVLNLANGQMRQSDPIGGLEEAVLVFSPDGRLLAAGSRSGEIYFFDAKTLELLAFKPGSIGAVSHLSFSTDGRRLLFAGEDAVIHVWEVKP